MTTFRQDDPDVGFPPVDSEGSAGIQFDIPVAGLPLKPMDNPAYEYGRLIAANAVGALSNDKLESARKSLNIDGSDERIAKNVAVALSFLYFLNARDWQSIIDIHHDPYIDKTYYGKLPISPKTHVRHLKGFLELAPDLSVEPDRVIVASGDVVVLRGTARGTAVEGFPGSPLGSSGKQWSVTQIHALEIIDGKIATYETQSPFENQFDEPFIGSTPADADIAEVRAAQGVSADLAGIAAQAGLAGQDVQVDVSDEGSLEISLDLSKSGIDLANLSTLEMIQLLDQKGPKQCQALIPPLMRRCAKLRGDDDQTLYCPFHVENGYGT